MIDVIIRSNLYLDIYLETISRKEIHTYVSFNSFLPNDQKNQIVTQ